MKAMVLAAGLGQRLRPLTAFMPKPLLPIAGEPLILWNLLLLRRYGITEVMVNLHYLGEQIEAALGSGSRWGLHLAYSHEPVLLGTGGGIKQVEAFFMGEEFLVLNADIVVELDLRQVIAHHAERRPLATMVLREDAEAAAWGEIKLGRSEQVVSINGLGRPDQAAVGGYMFTGVHVMHPRLLDGIPRGVASSIIDAYLHALEAGEGVAAYVMNGYWSDVGTPERYRQTQEDIMAGRIGLQLRKGSVATDHRIVSA